MLVIDEFGESAADYAETRAIALQRQGDDTGASTWRRIAPVIAEMQPTERKSHDQETRNGNYQTERHTAEAKAERRELGALIREVPRLIAMKGE